MKDHRGNKLPSGYSTRPWIDGDLEWPEVVPDLRVLWLRYIPRFGWLEDPATVAGVTKKLVTIRPDGSYARNVPIRVLSKDERNCFGI